MFSGSSENANAGWRVLDMTEPGLAGDILYPFAVDELEIERVGRGAPPLLHLWTHRQALVAGIRDAKLPYAAQAMQALRDQGTEIGVRHSGGSAVPLDGGVLNVSLIVPKPIGSLDFRDDFALMVGLLDRALRANGLRLAQGEVKGSYCPGEFDLSVRGRKFCGIAQRRQARAIAVQAFVVVEGSGEQRLQQAKAFYERAVGGEDAELDYPKLMPGSVASLAENGLPGATVKRIKEALLSAMEAEGAMIREYAYAAALEQDRIDAAIESIRRRYSTASRQ